MTEQQNLWGELPPQEMIFAWGKEHGFPEFLFDIKGYGGIIPAGEARWEQMRTATQWQWSDGTLTSEIWFEWCVKAIHILIAKETREKEQA